MLSLRWCLDAYRELVGRGGREFTLRENDDCMSQLTETPLLRISHLYGKPSGYCIILDFCNLWLNKGFTHGDNFI